MTSTDYSGIDLEAGTMWHRTGWSLVSMGLFVASIGAAIILVHVLVVLRYAQSLAE